MTSKNYWKKIKNTLVQKKEKEEAPAHRGSLCSDSISGYTQLDYETPAVIAEFLKNGEKIVKDKIANMKPDEYNDSFLDTYVERVIELAKDDLKVQRISHEKAIVDIRTAQKTRVLKYQKEIDKIDEEVVQLEQEMEVLSV